MRKPNLIVFEGIDGAGKATQVKLLEKRLRAQGRHVKVFSIPRYATPVGKVIKNALRGDYGDFRHLNPYLSSFPYMMDYALAREEFFTALKKGPVIFDRYVQSTFAYHGAKLRGKGRERFLKYIEHLAYRELKLPRPDRIAYLDVPAITAGKLMQKKKKDQHEQDLGYQKEVAQVYRTLAKGKQWRVIPCVKNGKMRSPKEIHELVWKAVQ